MLNHPPATTCPDLDLDAASASEAADVCSDAPSLQEDLDAIARLKNGRAAGHDGIPPELLKCATGPVAAALHSLILMVWREEMVPAEWRDGIITAPFIREKTAVVKVSRNPPGPDPSSSHFCQFRAPAP